MKQHNFPRVKFLKLKMPVDKGFQVARRFEDLVKNATSFSSRRFPAASSFLILKTLGKCTELDS